MVLTVVPSQISEVTLIFLTKGNIEHVVNTTNLEVSYDRHKGYESLENEHPDLRLHNELERCWFLRQSAKTMSTPARELRRR